MFEVVSVYSDGGLIRSNPSTIGGTWSCCHVTADNERVWSKSGVIVADQADPLFAEVGNNQVEFRALLEGLEALPDGWLGTAYTDSLLTIRRFRDLERTGLVGIPIDWRRRAAVVLGRLGRIEYVLLDGHPTKAQLAAGVGKRGNPVSEWNVWCDKACGDEAKRYMGIEPKPKRGKGEAV